MLFVGLLALIVIVAALAILRRPANNAPDAIRQRKNPIAPSEQALQQARSIYKDKCTSCHGDTGKGDGSDAMMYDPPPSDLSDARHMRKFTDGDLYYRITVGKKPMPAFEKRLTEEQRWELVLLVRSFVKSPQ